jgi:hypothetical protein
MWSSGVVGVKRSGSGRGVTQADVVAIGVTVNVMAAEDDGTVTAQSAKVAVRV